MPLSSWMPVSANWPENGAITPILIVSCAFAQLANATAANAATVSAAKIVLLRIALSSQICVARMWVAAEAQARLLLLLHPLFHRILHGLDGVELDVLGLPADHLDAQHVHVL